MAGLGKTALAQQVFNDARVTSYFDAKAWTCVSDDFDMLAITKSILQKIDCTLSCEDKDLDWLQDKLKQNLLGKKFLVVLDDVWNKNYGNWTILLKPFQSGAKGSKIIVTTRNSHVAEVAGAQPYTLKELSQEACVTLFAFHALGVRNFDHHPYLEALGLKIVEKCKGLPLAVKTLAGLLRTKVGPPEWQAILNSKIWDLSEEGNDILPTLKLSYLHLPSNLRRCFAYCAIFPKDYEIQRDELIHWWIAEGLVDRKKAKSQWNTGLNYFNELVSRSLFQKSSSNGSQFLMHDLVNDLAKLVAGASHWSSREFEFVDDHNNASLARHASFLPSKNIIPERLEIYHRMGGLRSFISLKKQYQSSYVTQKVLDDLLSGLKYLRVVSLSCYKISEVPECIGKLRHLRHLNLSHTHIETLPKSVVALHNLEALILQGCHMLIKLPEGMEKLINLRFLDIIDTPHLRAMPLNIGNLLGLEILSKFIIGMENGSRLNELKNLKNLQEELCIFDLHEVQEAREAIDANLLMKEGICRLNMQWCTNFENFRNEELETKVLDFLCPHQNLAHLEISYYGGLKFPSWLGSPTHVNIMCLHLHGCQRVKALPSLGQLSLLKELYIEGLNAICKVGSEFYGSGSPFSSLLTLEFKDMPLWEYWSHCIGTKEVGVVFPRLEHLVIQDCPMLIGRLPSQLSSLVQLTINSCPRMEASPSFNSLSSLSELKFKSCNERVLHSLVNLASLTALNINDVAELTCLNHGFTSSLIKLEKLEIKKCAKLIYLWQDGDVIQNLNCLKRLVVRSCPEFIYFVAEEGDIKLPSNLETIELIDCVNLEKLPSKMHTLSSLKDLMVHYCPKLVSFLEIGIPASLISLNIKNCQMLQSLPRGLSDHLDEPSSNSSNTHIDIISCLQDLRISRCKSLPSSPFSKGIFLPTTLKRLQIGDCRGVESLAEINLEPLQSIQEIEIWCLENLRSLPQGLHKLSRLTSLYLWNCPALELECFPPLPPSISTFRLHECPKIKSLPNQLRRLTSLQFLSIWKCERLTRFPEGGLPPQLERLWVSRCENMKQPVREWLTPLTSLQNLSIDSDVGGVGEEEDHVLPLPSSLLHLDIYDMKNMERLSSSLPPSLKSLWIYDCPKLRELPQDGLPPSLEDLWIHNCPILEERCRKGTGCYWPLIREIPKVTLGHDESKSIT
ncbi:putative disease resistance RPP13-like protein 1 [Eucalyptus grandis]|uniref:putative disease resistance RPP13-like protein 1 n=1 Tax=Eucalyptus grandis TaxID=71139 RepID=UPI00192EF2F0|nr:putative disease resistance RPP13-like protein 1 [Eucalyptus grandis]